MDNRGMGRIGGGPDAFLARMAVEAPSAVLVAEADTGTVVAVNDAATELFDRSRSSLVGVDQTELHPPESEDRYREGFHAIGDGQRIDVYDDEGESIRIRRRDGTVVPVDVRSKTVTYDGTRYVIGVFQDATDRLERLERLERQATAMDISPAGIGLLDDDGVYTDLNEAHVSMFGYDSADELIGGTWHQFYDDDVARRIEREVLPTVKEEGSWQGELVGRRRDGSPITQRVSLATFPDGGLACVNLDLTARERSRRRLEETRELVETLMTAGDRASTIAVVIDAITEIVDQPLAGYWTHDADADALVPVEASERGKEIVVDTPSFHPGESLAWPAFEAGEPAYYSDLSGRADAHNPDTEMQSEFIVPVGDDGALLVGSPETDGVPSEDRDIILIIARHLQTALRLADQRQQLREARERIENERNQLERVINTVPQLIFAKDTDGEFILANEAVAEAYGTSVSELIGSTDADYAADSDEVDAFAEDDRRVIETGESLHRTKETLTDADGTERVLETWKIPFTPVDSEETAVLGVANDITELSDVRAELTRQRQLTNLYAVSNRVFQASTPSEALAASVEAVADVVANDGVVIYTRDADDGALVRRSVAGESADGGFPERIEPGTGEMWRVLSGTEAQWVRADGTSSVTDGTDGGELLAVPLDDTGVLVVAMDPRDDEATSFIRAVARQVAAALTQLRQRRSIRELSDDVTETRRTANRYQRLWEAFVDAADAVTEAPTRDAVFSIVRAFGEHVGEYAFVGAYDTVADRIEPVDVSAAGGPAKLYEREDRFPAAVAGATNTTRRVADGRDTDHAEWLTQLLYFGYRSSIAVPLSHHGTVHGVVELASSHVDRFDGPERRAVETLGAAAGMRLSTLEAASGSGEPVTFAIECRGSSPLFPDMPAGGSIVVDHVAVTGETTLYLDGYTEGLTEETVRDYVASTPGLELETLEPTTAERCELSIEVVEASRVHAGAVIDVIARGDANLTGIRARSGADVLSFRTTISERISAVRSRLGEVCDSCSLVSKRHVPVADTEVGGSDDADLTDRQREVIETALRTGYYDDPRGTSGAELAERFGVSSSTLHQHLRAAESKVIRRFFRA